MLITVFGALGNMGSRVVAEALSRGHDVTAVVRDPVRLHELPTAANARTGDADNIEDVVALSAGQDVVTSATRLAVGSEKEPHDHQGAAGRTRPNQRPAADRRRRRHPALLHWAIRPVRRRRSCRGPSKCTVRCPQDNGMVTVSSGPKADRTRQ